MNATAYDPDLAAIRRKSERLSLKQDNPPLPVGSGLPPRLMSDIDPQSDLFGLSPEQRRDLMLDLAGGRYSIADLSRKYSISRKSVYQYKNRIADVLEIAAFARNVRDGMEARETLLWMLDVSKEVIERAKEAALQFAAEATDAEKSARAEARALVSDHLASMLRAVAALGEVTGEIVPATVQVAKVNRSRDVKLARMGALPGNLAPGGFGSASQPLQVLAMPRTYPDPVPSLPVPPGPKEEPEPKGEKRDYAANPNFPFGQEARVKIPKMEAAPANGGTSPPSEDTSDELLDVPLPSELPSNLPTGLPAGPTSPAPPDQQAPST